MKLHFMLVGLLLLSLDAHAADSDTIPLLKKTSPKPGEALEVPLIAPSGKSGNITKGPNAEGSEVDEEGAGAGGASAPYVASVDTFGSSRINDVALKAFLGKELDTWLAKGIKGDPEAMELETKLLNRVKDKWGFVQADWSIMEYFEGNRMPIHITLDVVDKADAARRMPFLPAPKGDYKDPEGLIRAWSDYEETALDLVETGELEPETETCPAFHCPFGHKHAKLKRYEKIFVDGVKKHAAELIEIQGKDKRGEWRAAATYLLAYLTDGNKVIALMEDRIKDPDAMVRNNALRVLGDIADFHSELVIPIGPVLEALRFPRVSDRSKAIYVVYLNCLNSPNVRDQIIKTSVPDLLQIMQSAQPDHRDLAHAIFRKVSGKEYAATDVQAWTNWARRLQKERVPSTKK